MDLLKLTEDLILSIVEDKDIVTEDDLKNVICNELDQLSPDIAFAYRNHDKII